MPVVEEGLVRSRQYGLATGHGRGVARILRSVTSFADLEPEFLGGVEELIDFVTEPGSR